MKKKLPIVLTIFFLSFYGYAQIPTDGLVGHYTLNEESTSDSSTSGYDLALIGQGSIVPVEDRFNLPDKAMLLIGEYMDLASDPTAFNFDSDSKFSLCTWIKLEDPVVDWTGLLNNWNDTGYYLGINPTQGIRWNVGGPIPIDSPDAIPVGEWVHIAATYNGIDAALYINGVLVGFEANNTPINASPLPFTVATQANLPDLQLPGVIDDILVYDRDLTLEEIEGIFTVLTISDVDGFSSNIKVYPNPTSATISFSYDQTLGTIAAYELTDLQGRVIVSNKLKGLDSTIDLSQFSNGIYLLTLETIDGISITKKIAKK